MLVTPTRCETDIIKQFPNTDKILEHVVKSTAFEDVTNKTELNKYLSCKCMAFVTNGVQVKYKRNKKSELQIGWVKQKFIIELVITCEWRKRSNFAKYLLKILKSGDKNTHLLDDIQWMKM